MRTSSSGQGFTLIELAVTLAIVSLLASMAVPTVEIVAKRNQEQELRQVLREIRRALDAYKQAVDEGRVAGKAGESGYPPNLKVLVEGVEDARSPEKKKIYFLRRIPRDPLSHDFAAPAEETWGLRSYASEPDDPAEGDDVFDVYAKEDGAGLNGVPYKQW